MTRPGLDAGGLASEIYSEHRPQPTDANAAALLDPDYARGLDEYDTTYQSVTDGVWQDY